MDIFAPVIDIDGNSHLNDRGKEISFKLGYNVKGDIINLPPIVSVSGEEDITLLIDIEGCVWFYCSKKFIMCRGTLEQSDKLILSRQYPLQLRINVLAVHGALFMDDHIDIYDIDGNTYIINIDKDLFNDKELAPIFTHGRRIKYRLEFNSSYLALTQEGLVVDTTNGSIIYDKDTIAVKLEVSDELIFILDNHGTLWIYDYDGNLSYVDSIPPIINMDFSSYKWTYLLYGQDGSLWFGITKHNYNSDYIGTRKGLGDRPYTPIPIKLETKHNIISCKLYMDCIIFLDDNGRTYYEFKCSSENNYDAEDFNGASRLFSDITVRNLEGYNINNKIRFSKTKKAIDK